MNTAKFTPTRTGNLVPIMTPGGPDNAFIPNDLPPNWELPPTLVQKLIDARTALALLDGIGRTLPDPELLLVPLKKREAITSSRIEGTYATAQELMLFEMGSFDSKSKNDELNSWREVHNYSEALSQGVKLLENMPFCGRVIKDLHKLLMLGVRGQHSVPGQWRDYQVAIGSDRRYVPPPPNVMVERINNLEKYINEESSLDPLVRAYLVHYQFEAIHPFADGNGRIGRVLLSLMVAAWCNLSCPWLYMSSFFEKFKDEYVENLFKISAEGAWDKWIEFCLNGTIHQATDAIARCEKLRALKQDMLKRVRPGSPRSEQIIDGLFSNPIVRISHLRRTLNVSYPTAQCDVDRLVKVSILETLNVRPKCYYSSEIFRIAYAEQTNGL